jgi:glycosyltransferase involved in cell wall biosynthesis
MPGPRLYIDIQTIQSLRFGDRGIPRLATELSRALLARDGPVAALALNPMVPWPRRIHPDLAQAPQLVWNTATAFRRALQEGPVISFVISPFEGARPVHATLAPHVTGVPEAVMVHDLIPDVFGYDPKSAWGRAYARRREWIRRADLVIAPSDNTRHDLAERWEVDPARVAVIGEAASPFFTPPDPGEDTRARVRTELPGIARPYVLSVSGPDGHKNTDALFDAWVRLPASLRRVHQLVVVCTLPDATRRAWMAHAERRGIGPDEIVLTGFVEDDVLRALYRGASLFVLPSRYEGFGLPVLEAIRCGRPAITSNASSLPEVLDWPEATFSPAEPDEIGGLIERALSDSGYRAELEQRCARAAERHTWARVVDRLLAACARLPQPAPRRRRRLRVALVGTFPPSASWTAGYNARVAEHLAAHCQLDCFTEPFDARSDGARPSRPFRMFPASSLGVTFSPASYDAVFYALDGTPDEVYRLARTYPGVVWLHDLALADRELTRRAQGFIVSSPDALATLHEELGPHLYTTPAWVIPLAASDASDAWCGRDDGAHVPTFDEVTRRVLEIAELDLEPDRPSEASALVTLPGG